MKCIKKKVCAECPFRKNAIPGWLGPDTALEVTQKVHSEHGYVCHMSIDKKPTDEQGRVDVSKHGHQCIGAIIHANLSCKTYRPENPLSALQVECEGMEKEYEILKHPEFIKYHTRKK